MDNKEVFQLSQVIEQKFAQFGYQLPFGRDLIASQPAEAIEHGLNRLRGISAISDAELSEHIGNYQWGNLSLSEVVECPDNFEQVKALLLNLDEWYERYVKEQTETDET